MASGKSTSQIRVEGKNIFYLRGEREREKGKGERERERSQKSHKPCIHTFCSGRKEEEERVFSLSLCSPPCKGLMYEAIKCNLNVRNSCCCRRQQHSIFLLLLRKKNHTSSFSLSYSFPLSLPFRSDQIPITILSDRYFSPCKKRNNSQICFCLEEEAENNIEIIAYKATNKASGQVVEVPFEQYLKEFKMMIFYKE